MYGLDAVSDDRLLNALFGGAVGGIASGLVYRAGATYGGTSTLARIIQNRTGTPMSSTLLYTESALIALAGVVFGWEGALYAVIAMVVYGLATDYVLEGPSVIRTAMIVTEYPREVSDARDPRSEPHRDRPGKRAACIPGRNAACCTSRCRAPKRTGCAKLVFAIDPHAFLVIGQGHAAYGEGFRHPRVQPPGETESSNSVE